MYKKYLSNLPPFQEAAVLEYAMDFRGELTRFSLRLERGNLQQQTALCIQGLTREQAHSLCFIFTKIRSRRKTGRMWPRSC